MCIVVVRVRGQDGPHRERTVEERREDMKN